MADIQVDPETKNTKELVRIGIRACVLQEYNAAVTALSKASEILVSELGDDLHESLGDIYLFYGKALLGLSREESDALGDAVPKSNNEDSEEDDIEHTETEGADKEGNDEAGTKEKTDEAETKGEDDEMETKEEETGKDATNGTGKEIEASAAGSGDAEQVEEKADDEEPTDLQVAWEVLELAKKIYEKKGEEGKTNLAETLTVLGEISLESENFEAAIADIKEGLRIQQELFDKDSRTVAETHYKLGVAYSTNSQIDEAIQSFTASLESLQNRISSLEKRDQKDAEVEEEIQEIKNLIPDIEEKISDMKSYKDETLKRILTAVTEPKASTGAASTSSAASSTKPVSDISHLVRKKRKLDEIAEESEKEAGTSPAKKSSA